MAVEVPTAHVEDAYSALAELVPGGCSIEEPIVPLGPEEGVRREPWRPSTVSVYFADDHHLAERIEAVRSVLANLPFAVRTSERTVREEDWANSWKEFFHVERIGRRLVIRPTWRTYAPAGGEVVLDLDPGMAFGTGQHETTRMCLEEVEERVHAGMSVLDVGCGSGILAIAAALLGAQPVVAVDTETVAVEATLANAERNRVSAAITVAEGSLDERWPFELAPTAAFDIVLANIHAAANIGLAPRFRDALRPGGTLIASGIIAERVRAVEAAFAGAGFAETEVRAAGEWRTVIARRPAGPPSGSDDMRESGLP
jgi:ribosomal protein L11 methyltransferase